MLLARLFFVEEEMGFIKQDHLRLKYLCVEAKDLDRALCNIGSATHRLDLDLSG